MHNLLMQIPVLVYTPRINRALDFTIRRLTIMTTSPPLNVKEKFEIQAYERPKERDLHTHIPFSGSPRKHPFDKEKIILIADPFTANTFYYEFNIKEIGFAEDLANMINIKGDAIPMARIWVKKQSVALRCTPFIVDAIRSEA